MSIMQEPHYRLTAAGATVLLALLCGFGLLLWLTSQVSPVAPTTGSPATVPAVAPSLASAPFNEKQAKEHQQRWADYLKSKVVESNSIGMNLTLIPPGKFNMGSPANEAGHLDAEELHDVELTQPFYVGVTTVTVGQFRKFVDAGNKPEGGDAWRTQWPEQTDDHPVTQVSWNDAVKFCEWLNTTPLPPPLTKGGQGGWKYILPTEAQWEYACRAGSKTRFYFGEDEKEAVDYCWYNVNSGNKTHKVGDRKPNAWGLYDMNGNVLQWVNDVYDANYYKASPKVTDPPGPKDSAGAPRVLRGGVWDADVTLCRAAYRNGHNAPTNRFHYVGLRVVLVGSAPGRARP